MRLVRWWRGFRFWHLVVSALASAGLAAAINLATTTPAKWNWVAAAVLLVVVTIGLGVWDLARDDRRVLERAQAARAQFMDPTWPGPIPIAGTPSDRPAEGAGVGDGLLFWLRAPLCPSPLRGRAAPLRLLLDWCLSGTDTDVVRIVSGVGGVGKSRLTVEVARNLPPGWYAGKPDPSHLNEAVERVLACGQPALLVVEDAERVEGVARLIARAAGADGVVRLVLTSRSGADLRERLRCDPDTAVGPVLRAPVLELGPIGGTEDRQRWYGEAIRAFAKALRMPRPDEIGNAPVGGVHSQGWVELV